MHLHVRLVIHDDQFCFIQIEHLAKLFSDLKLVASVSRGEGLLVSNPNKFFWVGLDIAALCNGQAERRCSQNIGDKPKALPVPRIQVWTGAFRIVSSNAKSGSLQLTGISAEPWGQLNQCTRNESSF